ncbi:MAG TPA: enoyl-CoA hydratase/isomerase family protein [Acidimicrobiales bacterium]|nr:enoyl-CoA hydratase/isomerase family protein [Acidimicrobiales bacterium]
MTETGKTPLHAATSNGVRLLTLNRPEQRNAFTIELYRALTGALRSADQDHAIGAVVLTGAGPAFCAGTDLGELEAISSGHAPEGAGQAFPGLLSVLMEIDVPLVAAVNGPGVGLGFTILSFCDLVFMARSARLRAPFAEMGVPPEAASSYLLPVRMGWQRAAMALLTGEWLSADAAVAAGIATEVCPDTEVLHRAVAEAERIAGLNPDAARTIKGLMQAGQREAVTAARAREEAAYSRLFSGQV